MKSTGSPLGASGAKALARLSLAMMTVALSACGGGGGGDAPSPPPPPPPPPATPSLTLRADASSVHAGDASVGLHATSTGSGDAVAWTLSGPGRLSANAGADVTYTPPDADSLDDDATATVTISAGSAAPQSVAIAIGSVDRPGHHWTLVQRALPVFQDLVRGGGAFVAVSSAGMSRSTDGLAWTDVPLAHPANALAWGDAGWVAIDGQGAVLTSADGSAWNRVADAIPTGVQGITFGNHTYLAYGDQGSAASADGVHWTAVDQDFPQVAFGNGRFMGLRQTPGTLFYDVHPYTSTDAIHWQPVTDVPDLSSLAFSGGQFVADIGAWFETTSDGSTWIATNQAPGLQGGRLMPAGDAVFERGSFDMGVLLPGSSWQRASTGDILSQPLAVAANADRFVGVSWNGWITTSTDGLHWSTQVEGSHGDLPAIAFVGGRFVAVSTLGRVLRSADGVTWTKAAMLGGPDAPVLYPRAMALGGGTLVAVGPAGAAYDEVGTAGPNGLWLRSADGGATWAQAATSPPAEGLAGVAHDGLRFMAITASGQIHASPDGDAWGRIGAAPAGDRYLGIAFGGGTWLAFTATGAATSPDGVAWTAIDPAALAGPASTTPRIATAAWDGTRFVMAGDWRYTASGSPAGSFAAVSADGRQWTTRASFGSGTATAITRCGDELVAVGNAMLASSTDGLTWNLHATVSGATQLEAVACGNDRFVGVGWGDAIVTSTR